MTKAKTMSREELLAELQTLDEAETVAKKDAEIADLRKQLADLKASRDKKDSELSSLRALLREMHRSMKPYTEALEQHTGMIYKGAALADAKKREELHEAAVKAAQAGRADKRVESQQASGTMPRQAPKSKTLSQVFPELAGPESPDLGATGGV